MGSRSLFWSDLTTRDFAGLERETTVVVLPIGAIEQHGPHLPISTDTAIAECMISLLSKRVPAEVGMLVLPVFPIGKSNEHMQSAGTLTLSAETLMRVLFELAQSVARAGLRKIVIVSSHGGNDDLLAVVKRELRVRLRMLAVATHWQRFGLPPGVFSADEERYGIHGGDIETSLMLHFLPQQVRMERAKNFLSSATVIEKDYKCLTPEGAHAFGWIAQDLNEDGVVGDARQATAEKGRLVAEHQVAGFIDLVKDMIRFPVGQLHRSDDPSI